MAGGDRLAVERRVAGSTVTYSHHGIDVGDGTVVHARPDDFRNPFGGGRVERTSAAEFAAGRPVRVVRDPPPAFPSDEIVARALAHVGRDGYCPVVDNCEHFATWCATGRRASRQVDLIVTRIAAAVGRVAAAGSARAAGRVAGRTLAGTTVRLGLRTLVPAAVVGEAAALVAEWRAHQRGADAPASRRAGDAAGLAATAGTCAMAGMPAGPAGVVTAALAGAALWLAGSVAAAATPVAVRAARRLAGG
jgi:hypothetical protein